MENALNRILLTTSLVALMSLSLNAEVGVSSSQLASSAAGIAQGLEDGNATEVVANELSSYALGALNSGLNFIEDQALATTNFTHLELSLGSDTLGLDTTGSKISAEFMSVYRLYEDETTNITSAPASNSACKSAFVAISHHPPSHRLPHPAPACEAMVISKAIRMARMLATLLKNFPVILSGSIVLATTNSR